ncbi:MAG TPA: hypothetical protein VK789_03815 [Bryobacteraceae bacterium]|nr:hypothetical protein [Bryobacteraceae bacterium]
MLAVGVEMDDRGRAMFRGKFGACLKCGALAEVGTVAHAINAQSRKTAQLSAGAADPSSTTTIV